MGAGENGHWKSEQSLLVQFGLGYHGTPQGHTQPAEDHIQR